MKINKQRYKMIKNIFLFTILASVIAIALSSTVSAKVFVLQNESVNMFVVNGSSGNIILNPNTGFGNVGIGTTSPTDKLVVIGNATIQDSIRAYGFVNFTNNTAFNQTLYLVNGNVGIGTTAPQALLNIVASSGTVFNITNTGSGNTTWIGDQAGDTSPFVIDASGSVGIGTTGPNSLSIGGGKVLDITSESGVGSAVFSMHDLDSAQESTLGTSGSGFYLDVSGHATASNNFFAIRTEETNSQFTPTERMRIDSSGNVGIGTTSPGTRLEVDGNITHTGVMKKFYGITASGTSHTIPTYSLENNDNRAGIANIVAGSGTSVGSAIVQWRKYSTANTECTIVSQYGNSLTFTNSCGNNNDLVINTSATVQVRWEVIIW